MLKRILILIIPILFLSSITFSQSIWDELEMISVYKIHKDIPEDGDGDAFIPLSLYNPANERYYYYDPNILAMTAKSLLGDVITLDTNLDSIDVSSFSYFFLGDITSADTIQISLTSDFAQKLIYYPGETLPLPMFDSSVSKLYLKVYGTGTGLVTYKIWGK